MNTANLILTFCLLAMVGGYIHSTNRLITVQIESSAHSLNVVEGIIYNMVWNQGESR